jgi:SAM-dependent methyltransferase
VSFDSIIVVIVVLAILGGLAAIILVVRARRAGLALHREIAVLRAELHTRTQGAADELAASRKESLASAERMEQGLAAIQTQAQTTADRVARVQEAVTAAGAMARELANRVSALAAVTFESCDRISHADGMHAPRRMHLRKLEGAVGVPQYFDPGSCVQQGGAVRILTPEGQWAYAATIPLFIPVDTPGDIWVRVRAAVLSGEAGFGVAQKTGSDFQDRIFVHAAPEVRTTFLRVTDAMRAGSLIIQNPAEDGSGGEILLEDVAVYADEPDTDAMPQSAWPSSPGAGDDTLLRGTFDILRRKWSEVPATEIDRAHSTDLLRLSDEELLGRWDHFHTASVTGHAFTAHGWYELMYREIFRGKKIVDFGCGLGITTIPFAQNGAEVTFVDLVPTNLEVVRRLCRLKGIANASFCYMEDLGSLAQLPADYDAIYCCGSLINAPLEVTRLEAQALLPHLKIGGRWIELAYPKSRWERDGEMPFDRWGEKTDGGAPWMEWHDLAKIRGYLAPAQFDVVLEWEFHNGEFNWFDLVRRS